MRPLRSRYNVSPENREQSQLSQLRFPAVCCLRTPFWCPLPLFYNQHGEQCLLPRVFFIIFLVSWVLWVVGFVPGSAQPPSALLCIFAGAVDGIFSLGVAWFAWTQLTVMLPSPTYPISSGERSALKTILAVDRCSCRSPVLHPQAS